jgi:hypothetical protein
MRRQLSVLLAVAFLIPQAVSGQNLAPGSRVRVTHPGEGTRTGTVVELSADTLEVHFDGRSIPAHLPIDQVSRLDVSRGKHTRVLARSGIGFMVGAAVGAGVGAVSEAACEPGNGQICLGAGAGALIGGIFFGAVGGIVGLVAGVVPSEQWERVPLQPRRFTLVAPPAGGGRGLGLSVAF